MRRMRIYEDPEFMGGGIFYRDEEKYMRDPELREAYECGMHKGYEKAMRESQFGERSYGGHGGYNHRGGINYRDDNDWDGYEERRRRDSMGRFR